MTSLIKLKDTEIIDIKDDENIFYEIGDTGGDSIKNSMKDFTVITSNGIEVEISSISFGTYGSASGIQNSVSLIRPILALISSGDNLSMTLSDFIEWFLINFVSGTAKIKLTKNKNSFEYIYLDNSSISSGDLIYFLENNHKEPNFQAQMKIHELAEDHSIYKIDEFAGLGVSKVMLNQLM